MLQLQLPGARVLGSLVRARWPSPPPFTPRTNAETRPVAPICECPADPAASGTGAHGSVGVPGPYNGAVGADDRNSRRRTDWLRPIKKRSRRTSALASAIAGPSWGRGGRGVCCVGHAPHGGSRRAVLASHGKSAGAIGARRRTAGERTAQCVQRAESRAANARRPGPKRVACSDSLNCTMRPPDARNSPCVVGDKHQRCIRGREHNRLSCTVAPPPFWVGRSSRTYRCTRTESKSRSCHRAGARVGRSPARQ